MSEVRHRMIRASAGSGKTYALTTRFVQLLAGGAPPERIVALTFTRKAAGEFFDEILNKLARAAVQAEAARILAEAIGRPQFGPGDFLRLLRLMIEAMPALRLGTLDSFFARIARSFPLELGMAGQFELLEEYGARHERDRVLQQLFNRGSGLEAAQKEFAEAFKRATFGREEKRLAFQLDSFLDDYQEKYLAAPHGAAWGNPQRIWPDGNAWLETKPDVPASLRALREWVEGSGQAEKARLRWANFFQAVENWRPGAPPPAELAYVLKKALAAWNELAAGNAVLEFDRKRQELSPAAGAALQRVVTSLMASELRRRLEITQGIHSVLRSYETIYDQEVRRAGRLTFADVQRLLMPGTAPALTGEADPGEGRLFVDYRLDAAIDHWLLDEFQDTSVGQWSVLANLIDEAVQDSTGGRTLFIVGDVKQAIFTWREGDPRLFQEVLDHYNRAAPGTIEEGRLVDSWRSGPALIEMVNAVFGDHAAIAGLFPSTVAAAWTREWSDHRTAVPQRTGQAALLHAEDEAARRQRMLEVLREVRPLERGLTCVVLVQKNSMATEVADYLRREGLPAIAESDLHVCTDNPVGAALLALVQAAAHPGDALAQEHLRMTPFGALLCENKRDNPAILAETVLGQIHAQGFEPTVQGWMRSIESRLDPDDGFSRMRIRQIAEAARLFDETGSREVAEFVAFMQRYTVRDADSAAVIRVMTIHKSKGLGFDVVVLPDLEGRKLDSRRKGLAIQKNADREVEWVLDLPSELFREGDPVLRAQVAEAEAEAGYEALSLLYVAMTRAKRAMYAIIKPVGKSESLNYPKLLTETLGDDARLVVVGQTSFPGAWTAGDPQWFAQEKWVEPAPREEAAPPRWDGIESARVVRHPARRPSDHKRGVVEVAPLFGLARGGGADFGAEVHRLLSEVEWWEPADALAPLLARWRAGGSGEEAMRTAAGCLSGPDLASIWARPAGADGAEVWRERSFEVLIDGVWFTGVFDRVVVELAASGKPRRARVVDFKTDRVPTGEDPIGVLVAKHEPQLGLYRRAAAILTGLPASQVGCTLALTSFPRLYDVSPLA